MKTLIFVLAPFCNSYIILQLAITFDAAVLNTPQNQRDTSEQRNHTKRIKICSEKNI